MFSVGSPSSCAVVAAVVSDFLVPNFISSTSSSRSSHVKKKILNLFLTVSRNISWAPLSSGPPMTWLLCPRGLLTRHILLQPCKNLVPQAPSWFFSLLRLCWCHLDSRRAGLLQHTVRHTLFCSTAAPAIHPVILGSHIPSWRKSIPCQEKLGWTPCPGALIQNNRSKYVAA